MISNDKKEEILTKAINKYTPEKQLVKLQEECGELITAISKYKLDPTVDKFRDVTEESVDVQLVLKQFFDNVYPFGVVREIEDEKLIRLDERMENEL